MPPFSIRWLVYTERNVHIRLSSSSFPPVCWQLKPDAHWCLYCACSTLFHLLILPFHAWTMTSNGASFLGFRVLATKQLADFFLGTPFFLHVVYKIDLPHKHYPSLYSDINRSTVSFEPAHHRKWKPISTKGKWKGMTELEERIRTEATGGRFLYFLSTQCTKFLCCTALLVKWTDGTAYTNLNMNILNQYAEHLKCRLPSNCTWRNNFVHLELPAHASACLIC